MLLVERHVIKPNHPYFQEIDAASKRAKNLFNRANYVLRQHFFSSGEIIPYTRLDKLMQKEEAYLALPSKVSQQVLLRLSQAWKSWSRATKAYESDPSKFLGQPRIPKYKDKVKGRYALVYTSQAISKRSLKKGWLKPSKLEVKISTLRRDINEVRLVPYLDYYVVEIVYEPEKSEGKFDSNQVASIDLGLNNLATVTSNQKGFIPLLVNGRPLKSINQFYNKHRGKLQSSLKGEKKTSRRIRKLTAKRNFKIDDYLHKASRLLLNHLVKNQIGTLVIGKNDYWKQESHLGRKNNQNFVNIPHYRFIEMLIYKAQLVGICVITQEESYTSKASFLDFDPIPNYGEGKYPLFSGYRVKRGLYKSKVTGRKINADVNGSLNILRKAAPSMLTAEGVEGVVVRPVKVTLPK